MALRTNQFNSKSVLAAKSVILNRYTQNKQFSKQYMSCEVSQLNLLCRAIRGSRYYARKKLNIDLKIRPVAPYLR